MPSLYGQKILLPSDPSLLLLMYVRQFQCLIVDILNVYLTPFFYRWKLQNVECMPGPLFQDFLQLLATIRSEIGLPLHVILLAPPGRSGQMRLNSATQGMEGMLLSEFSLPTSKVMYGKLEQCVGQVTSRCICLTRSCFEQIAYGNTC